MRRDPVTPLTESAVLAALRDCYHPELRVSLVDLGLVHSIAIQPDASAPGSGIPGVPPRYSVHIELLPTTGDPAGDDLSPQLFALIQNRLAAFPAVSRTHVQTALHSAWTPERIAPQLRARVMLAIASNHRPDDLVQIQTNHATQPKGSQPRR